MLIFLASRAHTFPGIIKHYRLLPYIFGWVIGLSFHREKPRWILPQRLSLQINFR